MNFITDKQTLDDLNILGKPGTDSVYALYNNTYTRGGADILEQMFLYPLAEVSAINNRCKTFQYFKSINVKFPFRTENLDSAENYLGMTDKRTMLSESDKSLARKFSQLIAADGDYQVIFNGIAAIAEIWQTMQIFVVKIKSSAASTPYALNIEEIETWLSKDGLSVILAEKQVDKLSYQKIAQLDKLLRFEHRATLKQLLTFIYQLDVFLSVAEVALKRGYVFPKALPKDVNVVKLTGVYHPLVKNATANSLNITPDSNIVFLTGANMAGKSTFMKSLGIALYLAHMGFPVAAQEMEFSVRDGIYTTINLPDDLNSGNSHFYAEVLRVKKIAKELGVAKNLFVIFDELFRGTNVKDAYEGTIAITQAFAAKRNCMFVVSTHIIEAGDVLKQRCSNINFVYLPTRMDDNKPVYTYRLEQGITADRHGMIIINNEGILEILSSRKNKTT
ncbi:DNA mismatch repair protein [Mucilaginibacter corticis]|uniref:DNA mismatch repair protein n=1 Tax=Mucilaginibacter corticis TaxID=2597670 RepID=A0A556M911_9SPHI|nr:DNA mismatch repair protein [Mucilaginibacter corticis]TSJ36417.1 DNA mismatch repair protein [Mucilaginibacter corticis]